MAAHVKKTAARAAGSGAGKATGKATRTEAVAAHPKEAKPVFGKSAPKKVVPITANKGSKPPASKNAPRKADAQAKDGGGSVVAKVARAARTTAAVAVGAVVATAKLAKPSRKRKDGGSAG